ncbi:hypothetical protein HCJ93_15970 [Streptomyces sp. SBST2-5]|uniref:Uncharacterized protein n=1 Tax=Streptomyces composti TaxID=2720025 RepID=A0ABX1A8I0_9ACTN|nr:hypothetical protein [Streptomyces composti]NJP51525.1 hypothetical protein [Streptomyces composti]
MNDAITNEAPTTESGQIPAGRGKHRGPVATHDTETTPRGRHRKPVEENEPAESAA